MEGAAGNLRQAEMRQAELMERRRRRREELDRQASLTLQGVERMTTVLVLPHPEREKPEVRNLRPDPETEQIAMRVAMEYERSQGRVVATFMKRISATTSPRSMPIPASCGSSRSKDLPAMKAW